MKPLALGAPGSTLNVLCLGAHSDDIEIGVGGTLLQLMQAGVLLNVHLCVLSALEARHEEALAGAGAFLHGAASRTIKLGEFRDSYFPSQSADIKGWIADLKSDFEPDVVFTHNRDDAHQDHREVARFTWNTFRDQTVLEYEIPKWDGDLGQPNAYMALSEDVLERKITLLNECFGSQRSKDWFDADTFRGLARLRGIECRAPGRFAEAFFARKLRLG